MYVHVDPHIRQRKLRKRLLSRGVQSVYLRKVGSTVLRDRAVVVKYPDALPREYFCAVYSGAFSFQVIVVVETMAGILVLVSRPPQTVFAVQQLTRSSKYRKMHTSDTTI